MKRGTKTVMAVAALGAVGVGLSPVAAGAEAGCDDGENSGATKILANNQDWVNTNDAWRFYVRYSPPQTDSKSQLRANNKAGDQFYNTPWVTEAGPWTNSHFSELANEEAFWNQTGVTHTYFYMRSCTK